MPIRVEHQTRLLALTDIRLARKFLSATDALAYFVGDLKRFLTPSADLRPVRNSATIRRHLRPAPQHPSRQDIPDPVVLVPLPVVGGRYGRAVLAEALLPAVLQVAL